jgi:hypothetical protein
MRLTNELDHQVDIALKQAYFVGRLATDDEMASRPYDAPVYMGDDGRTVHFYLKCLSEVPDVIRDNVNSDGELFNGSTLSPVNVSKFSRGSSFIGMTPADQRKYVEKYLTGKTIIFKLVLRQTHIYAEIERTEDVVPADAYLTIPVPTNLSTSQVVKDFEGRMAVNRPLELKQYPNFFARPAYLLVDDFLYTNVHLREGLNPTSYYFEKSSTPSRVVLTSDFYDWIDVRMDHLYFMNKNFEFELERLMKEDGNAVDESEPTVAAPAPIRLASETADSERVFLDALMRNARARGLYYDEQDLVNFHISVKTNNLTIIGGMSGTGKSQLARVYGETLGLAFGESMLLVPVSPAFHEPNDVLGFYNPVTNDYYESELGFVSLLQKAAMHPGQLFMVIFDEMNLAQVEHWFAPFISLLEVESGNRNLQLFSSADGRSGNGYLNRIPLGDNVIFVGTVNFDETTKPFSNRLLDRSNLISPRKLTFAAVHQFVAEKGATESFSTMPVHAKDYRTVWTNPLGDWAAFAEAEIQLLDEMHRVIHAADQQKGVSFRAVNGIASYLMNIPVKADGQSYLSREEAFDLQLKQRVLTKLSGSSSVIGDLVGKHRGGTWVMGTLANLLVEAEETGVGIFTHCLRALEEKAKELSVHGYAV